MMYQVVLPMPTIALWLRNLNKRVIFTFFYTTCDCVMIDNVLIIYKLGKKHF